MHKKLLKMLLIISFILVLPVHAACSYKEQAELNREVTNIKATYEIVTKTMTGWIPETDTNENIQYEAFRINIVNLSDNFYIKYSNNVDKDVKTVYSSNAVNGVISFDWEDLRKVTTITFSVYSSSKTGCRDQLQRTFYLTLPRYNEYSSYDTCDGREEYSICEKYVTFDEISYDEFLRRIAEKNTSTPGEQNNTNTNTTVKGNYTIYYVIGVAAAVLVISVVIIANRKRNKL